MSNQSPSKSDVINQSPSKSDMTIQSPSKSDVTIQSPSKLDVTIQSPSKSDVTIQSPSKSDMTIQSPSKSDVTIQSPSKSDETKCSATENTDLIDVESPEEFEWTLSLQRCLLICMRRLKPCGIHKYLCMALIQEKLKKQFNVDLPCKVIWDYLATQWDLRAADEIEGISFDTSKKPFVLPEEYDQIEEKAAEKIKKMLKESSNDEIDEKKMLKESSNDEIIEKKMLKESSNDEINEKKMLKESSNDEINEKKMLKESSNDEINEKQMLKESSNDEINEKQMLKESSNDEINEKKMLKESSNDEINKKKMLKENSNDEINKKKMLKESSNDEVNKKKLLNWSGKTRSKSNSMSSVDSKEGLNETTPSILLENSSVKTSEERSDEGPCTRRSLRTNDKLENNKSDEKNKVKDLKQINKKIPNQSKDVEKIDKISNLRGQKRKSRNVSESSYSSDNSKRRRNYKINVADLAISDSSSRSVTPEILRGKTSNRSVTPEIINRKSKLRSSDEDQKSKLTLEKACLKHGQNVDLVLPEVKVERLQHEKQNAPSVETKSKSLVQSKNEANNKVKGKIRNRVTSDLLVVQQSPELLSLGRRSCSNKNSENAKNDK
ncbi:MRG-binding protein [Aphis craccivora]|uniref:MRG-binding protein n=1 Tax=Aphis craccivora TaxID=307492 RepID=A0A6G0YF90_APHCR|nr:MRG-binding protein [Aphis craccivora]